MEPITGGTILGALAFLVGVGVIWYLAKGRKNKDD
jgi:hypothetical protein